MLHPSAIFSNARLVVVLVVAAAAAGAAASAGGGDSGICSAIGKANANQPLKTCKPFVNAVCDGVRSPACADKLCTTLTSEDGCDLATRGDVDAAINAFETPLYGEWFIDLDSQLPPPNVCKATPTQPEAGPSTIKTFCTQKGEYVYVTRRCPPDGKGGYLIAVQGSCGVVVDNDLWDLPIQASGTNYAEATCAFRPSDLPPEFRGGRLYTSVTCVRTGLKAGGFLLFGGLKKIKGVAVSSSSSSARG